MASFKTFTFDPSQMVITFMGKVIDGFASDTFLNVQMNEQAWNLAVGVQSIATRVKTTDRSGRYTFTLQMASPSNDDLMAIYSADDLSNSGKGTVVIRDGSGRTRFESAETWIVKLPDSPFSNTSGQNREWVLETGNMTAVLGGLSD